MPSLQPDGNGPLRFLLNRRNERRLNFPIWRIVVAEHGSELLAQNPKPTEAQIRAHMNGHLCRCGTYPRIMKSIQLASAKMAGETR